MLSCDDIALIEGITLAGIKCNNRTKLMEQSFNLLALDVSTLAFGVGSPVIGSVLSVEDPFPGNIYSVGQQIGYKIA